MSWPCILRCMNYSPPAPEDIALDTHSICRIGTVLTVDRAEARCTCRIGDAVDGAIETPPIRWLAPRAGQTRIWSPPSIGEQVIILCPGGELAGAVALPGIVSDIFPPIGNDQTEMVSYNDGAQISYDPIGHILTATLPAGSTLDVTADTVRITGDVQITGDVTATGIMHSDDDVTAGANRTSLTDHRHLGVTTGGGTSGPPAP